MIAFVWLFADRAESRFAQAALPIGVTTVVVAGLILVAFFDRPYQDTAGAVRPTAMEHALTAMSSSGRRNRPRAMPAVAPRDRPPTDTASLTRKLRRRRLRAMPHDSPNAAVTGAPDALLEQWFEQAQTGLALVDRQGTVLRANAAVRQLAGRDAAALLAEPAVSAALKELNRGSRPAPVRLPCASDTAAAVAIAFLPLPGAAAMTVQRVADDRLTEETLRLALEGTQTGSWVWDVATDVISWSANLGPLHGMARGAAPTNYEQWLSHVHPEDRDAVAALVSAALEGADSYACEFRLAGGEGGTERWLHSRAHVMRDGPGVPARAIVGLTTDVTARHRREEAMEVLADAGLALAATRTPEANLQRIADLVVPRLADWCAAHLLDAEGRADTGRHRASRPRPHRVGEHARGRSDTARVGPAEVLRTGRRSCTGRSARSCSKRAPQATPNTSSSCAASACARRWSSRSAPTNGRSAR